MGAGFRDSGWHEAEDGSGKLYYIGYAGYIWSSSIPSESINAHFLDYSFLARQASKTPCGRSCVASGNTQRVSYWGSLRLISNRA